MTPIRTLVALALATALLPIASARAEEKFLGTVVRIEMTGPSSAVATLKSEDGKTLDLHVDDAITVEKLKDKRIGPGDLIKAKYEVRNRKNSATYFKKPGGC